MNESVRKGWITRKKNGNATPWNKSKPHSETTKLKIRLARKNQVFSQETKQLWSKQRKGRVGTMKGKKHSIETRKKMADSHVGLFSGEKNPNWKGGITPFRVKIWHSVEYKLWRTAVFERDKYTCVWCGGKGDINADHIKPFALYPELRFAIDNGRTLCVPCHRKTDTYGGRKVKNTLI